MATSTITIIDGASTVTLDNTVSIITLGNSGPQGAPGEGVPVGGTTGQILQKDSATDYDTSWIDNYTTDVRKYVKNDSGSTLAKGTVVYVSGANGANVLVKPALATADGTSATTIGFLNETLANNGQGYAIVEGTISGIDTSAATAGDPVWLSGSVAGGVLFGVANKPQAPVHIVYLGTVTRAHVNQGQIEISVNNGWELDELHNVAITSPSDGQVLTYNAASSLWVNSSESGDISAVNVTSPITGGGTSGAVTIGINQAALSVTASQISDGTTTFARLGAANAFSVGGHTITNSVASTIPLLIKGAASQSVNLFEVRLSDNTLRAQWNSAGNFTQYGSANFSGALNSNSQALCAPSASNVQPLLVRGAAAQTANLQEWQNSAGSVLARVNSSGTYFTQSGGSYIANNGQAFFGADAATRVPLTLKGTTSQTGNLTEWQDSGGNVLGSVSSGGTVVFEEIRLKTTNNAALRPIWGGNGGVLQLRKGTASTVPGATDYLQIGVVDGTNAGTLKLVVRAGTAGAQTTILDNIPQ